MTNVPDFNALDVAYQFGASNSRNRYEKWFGLHPTKTMLETIMKDMSPASSAVNSGFSAYVEGESTIFDFEDFLNQLVSAYVGKQKFLDEAKETGTITEAQYKVSSELVSRHIAALVANGAETVRKDGALLTFNPANRLQVSLVEGDDMALTPDPAILASAKEEEAPVGTIVPVLDPIVGTVNIPSFYKTQALFPMLVEDVLLQFSRMFYSGGSSPEALASIASHNSEAVEQMDKKFDSLSKLYITSTDFLDHLTGKGIAFAAQKKFLKYLLINKSITKAVFDEHNVTVDSIHRNLMASASRKLATLNVQLSYDETARLVIKAVDGK